MRKLIITASLAFSLSATAALADDMQSCERLISSEQYELALQPCTAAAEQGLPVAQYNLGLMYRRGLGVAQNNTEAVRWYRAAAEQEYITAQQTLGFMYSFGLGVPENLVQAHMWFNIAAANGVEGAAGYRNRTAAQMTPEQIAEAQTRAQRCLDSNYSDC